MAVTPEAKRQQCRESMRKLRIERKTASLPPRERRLVSNVVAGNMTVTKCLTDAGFHRSSTSLLARLKPDRDLGKIVAEICRGNGLTPDRVIKATADTLDADKPTGTLSHDGSMHMVADHQSRLRGAELGIKVLQAAGEWPTEHAQPAGSGHVRLVQILPDGTQQAIEITA